MDNLTIPGQAAYNQQIRSGNIRAIATVRRSVIRQGAYELTVGAFNATQRPLGSKQQIVAATLKREAQRDLVGGLLKAGWRTEEIKWGGRAMLLWWPPVLVF